MQVAAGVAAADMAAGSLVKQFAAGDTVEYFSASKKAWTKAKVKKIHSKTIDLGDYSRIPAVNSSSNLCC